VQATRLQAGLLAEYSERLDRLHYSPHTRRAYLRIARKFLEMFLDVDLSRFTPEHVERYLYAQKLSARSFSTDLENLRAFFTWLHRQKRLVRENPCDRVERPRWRPKLRPAPTWQDFCALRNACQIVEDAVLLEVLYFTGVRMCELRAIQIKDVDLGQRRILVHGKGGKDRIVVFPPRVGTLLRLHALRQALFAPDTYVFRPGGLGNAIQRSERAIRRILRRLGQVAGIPYRVTPHVLRHGYFRLLKTKGVPLEVASKLGGHSDIRVTAHIYGQMDTDDLQAAYDRHVGETT